MSAAAARAAADYAVALDKLRTLCPPGTTVYNILRHVSRSGMQQVIDSFVLHEGRPFYLRGWMRDLGLGPIYRTHDGLIVNGCGMDMGWHLVYRLSSVLYRDGYGCTGDGCWSNDHSNGDRDYTPHVDHAHGDPNHVCAKNPASCTATKHWHKDGGYALRAQWV